MKYQLKKTKQRSLSKNALSISENMKHQIKKKNESYKSVSFPFRGNGAVPFPFCGNGPLKPASFPQNGNGTGPFPQNGNGTALKGTEKQVTNLKTTEVRVKTAESISEQMKYQLKTNESYMGLCGYPPLAKSRSRLN